MHVTSASKKLKSVVVMATLLFAILFGRVVYLTFMGGRVSSKNSKDILRGPIVDRRGMTLARTEEASTIAIAPSEVLDAEFTARQLSPRLETPLSEIMERLEKNQEQTYFYLKRHLDNYPADQIMELNLPGVHREWEHRRIYPGGTLAANLLGFVGRDRNLSLAGLERIFHSQLVRAELPGSIVGPILHLTIDSMIQHRLEKALEQGFERSNSKRAAGIIMDITTGEILALANLPTYDPNEYYKTVPFQRANWATRFNYEPGSTVKIFMAAILLNENAVSLKERFYCDGSISIGDTNVHCKHNGKISKHGWLTFPEILAKSCNVGTIKLMQRIDDETFHGYMQALGFGEKTGILPDNSGETSGYFPPRNIWVPSSSFYIPIGQSFSVTPIQLLRAAASLANGGHIVKPLLAQKITTSSGKILNSYKSGQHRNPFRKKVNRTVVELMRAVVRKGTGRGAYLKEIDIAGKTGTAQKSSTEGYVDQYVVSFIGFFPAEKPRYGMLILYDEPEGNASGGSLAAPVFAQTLRDILPIIGQDENVLSINDLSAKPYPLPKVNKKQLHDFNGLSARESMQILTDIYGLPLKLIGSGYVFRQEPPPGTPIENINMVKLYLDEN